MAHVGQRCRLCDDASALIPSVSQLCADKGYDTDAFRAFLKANKVRAVIPTDLIGKSPFAMTSKLTTTATSSRYAKLVRNFVSGLCVVATLAYWL
jgi:transposase